MSATVLCILSLIAVFFCGRRSIGCGLVALLVVGYAYGILRANLPTTASHFIFDAAVLGFYAATFMSPLASQDWYRSLSLRPWLLVLILWPAALFFVPVQDWMVQLVGLRGAVFFLP